MLQKTSLQFLKKLAENNDKNWFEANRKKYENTKADFTLLVQEIINATAKFDGPIGTLIPKQCMFRINRDVRFSKDKSPYKTNMGASFSAGGKKADGSGYYFHCEPGKSFAAGGYYMPMPPELGKIRQEVDYNFDEWEKIIAGKNFIKKFPKGVEGSGSLVRPPKGYYENNPAIEYLKLKGFIVSTPVPDNIITDKKLVTVIAASFETMKPMIDFLNNAVK